MVESETKSLVVELLLELTLVEDLEILVDKEMNPNEKSNQVIFEFKNIFSFVLFTFDPRLLSSD